MVEPVAKPRRWPRVLNAVLGMAGLVLAAFCVASVLLNPFGGMRAPAYLVIWIAGFVGLNRSLALLQDLAPAGGGRRTLRIAKWILPWVLPVPAIKAAEGCVLARQLEVASRELAPVVAFADAQPQGQFAAGLAPAVAFPVPVHYGNSGRRYALWLTAPSIDIDGYSMKYDAGTGRWQRVHNDLRGAEPSEVSRCVLERAAWRCAPPAPEP